MNNTQVVRTKDVFVEALDRSATARAAYLDEACADRAELRERVEVLLAHAEADDRFLRSATLGVDPLEAAPVGETVGTRIGSYKLLGLIGEGGFGMVYLAEQEEPVRRRVALKIIKLGMDTRAVIARFEQERQALAVMHHPNIAKVLDAGTTAAGRPYFVMELVRGDPITAFCDRNSLGLHERLALFTQVCQGVQHAHSKGVIHRDIKPSNVLVTMEDSGPLARIIDFGIAKATTHRFTEKTVFTAHRQIIGTLEYMSPEQAAGSLDVDTRADVYSLGVLLYELLTGFTPLDPKLLHTVAYAELQRIIREDEPPRPSIRLGQSTDRRTGVAADRRLEPRVLARTLRGDLDWIVMRALEKDRARRYETASALAADIQRYLAGGVVEAVPPRTTYKIRRFARRHRAGVVAASLVAATVLLGAIGTSVGLVQALRERDKAITAESTANERLAEAVAARTAADSARAQAEKSNKIANAVTQFFTQDVLDLTPVPGGAPEPTVRQLLDAVPAKIDRYFQSDPAVEGIIRERVGQLYRRLGEIDRSRGYLEDAIPLLERGLGPDHKQTLAAFHRLGELNIDLRRFDAAAELFDKAYQGRLRAHGPDYSYTMGSLGRRGYARVCAGAVEDGFRDLNDALTHYQSREQMDSRNVCVASLNLCDAFLQVERADEAQAIARRTLDAILAKGGDIAGLEWGARIRVGIACRMQRRLDEAMGEFAKVLDITERIYPPAHPEFIQIRLEYGRLLGALGRKEQARTELEAAYSLAEAVFGAPGAMCQEIAACLASFAEQWGDVGGAARWREHTR